MAEELVAGLRSMVTFARLTVPFYAALPSAEPPDDLEAFRRWFAGLPILTRADLHQNRDRLVSLEGDRPEWQRVRTSGFTGEPVEVIVDSDSRTLDAEVLAGFIDRRLGSGQWRSDLFLHLVLHPGALSRRRQAEWSGGGEVAKWNLAYAWQLPDADFLHVVRHFEGKIVATLPSVAELIAKRVADAAPTRVLRPRLLLLSGEGLIEPELRTIQQTFACPVAAAFTLAEIGIVGLECGNSGSFHVALDNAYVEILRSDGMPALNGEPGDLVVTGLANRAMPLIRYRTGDCARWAKERCDCGQENPRFVPEHSRRPTYLYDSAGRSINLIRFGKLMAGLGFRKYALEQSRTGGIVVAYDAPHPVEETVRTIVESSVRTAMGPSVPVSWRRIVANPGKPLQLAPVPAPESASSVMAEPLTASLVELIPWLRQNIEEYPGIVVAVITGSALDPLARTRYSDLDVVLLGREDAPPGVWLSLAQRLRRGHTGINLMHDRIAGLERRAPLFTVRLLCEHTLIMGCLDQTVLAWPRIQDLSAEARFWAQTARAEFTHRVINPPSQPGNPVAEAWRNTKVILQALRFLRVLAGSHDTRFSSVLQNASIDRRLGATWFTDFVSLLDIAREHVAPPVSGSLGGEESSALVLHALNVLAPASAAVSKSGNRFASRIPPLESG
jgi:phenylacetate-coenzyme A ligase PaaK-like adenylate-forming protein